MATLPRVAIGLAVASLAACHAPVDDYNRFVSETADLRRAEQPIASSHFEDLSGRWLVNALLAGGLTLGLRMRLAYTLSTTPVAVGADVWLAAANPDTDPVLTHIDSTVDDTGRFVLSATPLVLKQGAVTGLNVDVQANVIMDNYTQSVDAWCGAVSGNVIAPLELDLAGSSLGAARDDAGTLMLADVPSRCPPADMQ